MLTKDNVKRGMTMTGDAIFNELVSARDVMRKSIKKGDFIVSDSGSEVALKTRPRTSMQEAIERMGKAKEIADQIVKSLRESRQS